MDIAAHQLSADGQRWMDFLNASGGPWGSGAVNDQFLRMLDGAVGSDQMAHFRVRESAAYGMSLHVSEWICLGWLGTAITSIHLCWPPAGMCIARHPWADSVVPCRVFRVSLQWTR